MFPCNVNGGQEYGAAVAIMEEMNYLRRAWAGLQPEPPLKRSDIMLMGTIEHLCQKNNHKVTVSNLAKVMKQSAPGISQKVSMLEQMGYVRRTVDKTDRRVAYIALTAKGNEAAQGPLREFLGRLQKALECLGVEKTTQLLELMKQLREAIAETQTDFAKGESET